MDTITTQVPTTLCEPFAGGFYAGRIRVDGTEYALIVAPKTEGEHADCALGSRAKIAGASSFWDGSANTLALADAGSALAQWALDLRIGDFDDWYLPSRDELEICYRAFKPTKEGNYVWRNGDNPSSVPPGYPYTETSPAQTANEAFKDGGPEAFAPTWYWASTQYEGGDAYAWCQGFYGGGQYGGHEGGVLRARAVRRVAI